MTRLNTKTVGDVTPSCFTGPDYSHDLPSLHAIVPRYWIAVLYSRQLSVSDFVPVAAHNENQAQKQRVQPQPVTKAVVHKADRQMMQEYDS